MSISSEDYWPSKLQKYAKESWAKQPSLFAQSIKEYLPAKGALLEIGAGLGQDGIWFAEQGPDVTQTDLVVSEFLPIPNGLVIKREVADLSKPLSYSPASYDVVYAHLSLHYFDAKRTAELFKEIYQILKPGGVLAILINSLSDPEISEGTKLEDNYYEVDGIKKRYFDVASLKPLVTNYEALILDEKGTSYKDQEKGINNLVRFVGKKEGSL